VRNSSFGIGNVGMVPRYRFITEPIRVVIMVGLSPDVVFLRNLGPDFIFERYKFW
jgi:hypothetical protein